MWIWRFTKIFMRTERIWYTKKQCKIKCRRENQHLSYRFTCFYKFVPCIFQIRLNILGKTDSNHPLNSVTQLVLSQLLEQILRRPQFKLNLHSLGYLSHASFHTNYLEYPLQPRKIRILPSLQNSLLLRSKGKKLIQIPTPYQYRIIT